MSKIVGTWSITYIETMVTSTIICKADNTFIESKSGLEGTYSLLGTDLSLEFGSIVLPGQNNIPLTLEAGLFNNFTKFKGALYNRAYPNGILTVTGTYQAEKPWIIREILGTWNVSYECNHTNTTIDFNIDGTFFQKKGNYEGKWSVDDVTNTVELIFTTLKFPNENGPMTLIANVIKSSSTEPATFSGSRNHPAYPYGKLVFKGNKC